MSIFILYFTIIIDSYNYSNRLVMFLKLELPTLPERLSLSPVFSGVRVTRSIIVCVCFVDRCLSFCIVSFGDCAVCSSVIYGFWWPLWYLQTLLVYHFVFSNTCRIHIAISRIIDLKFEIVIRYKPIYFMTSTDDHVLYQTIYCMPFGITWVHLLFRGVRFARFLVCCVMCCRSLFVFLLF
jgi:hypothetical protein